MSKSRHITRRLLLATTLLGIPTSILILLRRKWSHILPKPDQYELEDKNRSPTLPAETSAGWVKSKYNPILGGTLGTCFDVAVLREEDRFRMWFSWRPKKSIALVESKDGIHWSKPLIALAPNESTQWEEDINRPLVLKQLDTYHMWYTGQKRGHSSIGHATSPDGMTWSRTSTQPVLSSEQPWEKSAVMCPSVIWDNKEHLFKMWYSGGEQYEPDAIGYATSPDGKTWLKSPNNPIFSSNPQNSWEAYKIGAAQVTPYQNQYLMFYIGFQDVNQAQIGLARSSDGVRNWQRHPSNPIIRPGISSAAWDYNAVYKPFALLDDRHWLLWYNGRHHSLEQIGLAIHEGEDLWL
jgi:predicted GH43/DUF377 family glycosyl hydrolase